MLAIKRSGTIPASLRSEPERSDLLPHKRRTVGPRRRATACNEVQMTAAARRGRIGAAHAAVAQAQGNLELGVGRGKSVRFVRSRRSLSGAKHLRESPCAPIY